MSDDGNADGDANGLVATPVLVGHIGTEQWCSITRITLAGSHKYV